MAQFQITFRGMTPSDALRAVAQEKFCKLAQKFGRTASCSIVVDHAAGKARGQRSFAARVQLHPGGQGEQVYAAAEHTSASVAVREAFERASAQVSSARADTVRRARPDALLLLREARS
jgi:ribosome-associated translation inhibitor RaiA